MSEFFIPKDISFYIISLELSLAMLPICKHVRNQYTKTSTYQIIKRQWTKRDIFYKAVTLKDWKLVRFILEYKSNDNLSWAYIYLYSQKCLDLLPEKYRNKESFKYDEEYIKFREEERLVEKFYILMTNRNLGYIKRQDYVGIIYNRLLIENNFDILLDLIIMSPAYRLCFIDNYGIKVCKGTLSLEEQLAAPSVCSFKDEDEGLVFTKPYKNYIYRNRQIPLFEKLISTYVPFIEREIEKEIENSLKQKVKKFNTGMSILTIVLVSLGIILYRKSR